eukprot:9482805-Pyramimonas_sp.AAC.2
MYKCDESLTSVPLQERRCSTAKKHSCVYMRVRSGRVLAMGCCSHSPIVLACRRVGWLGESNTTRCKLNSLCSNVTKVYHEKKHAQRQKALQHLHGGCDQGGKGRIFCVGSLRVEHHTARKKWNKPVHKRNKQIIEVHTQRRSDRGDRARGEGEHLSDHISLNTYYL